MLSFCVRIQVPTPEALNCSFEISRPMRGRHLYDVAAPHPTSPRLSVAEGDIAYNRLTDFLFYFLRKERSFSR